jgi:hypothetical protein
MTDASAAVRIQVSDKSSGEDLKAYLEAGECVVRKVAEVSFMGEVTFDVSIPRAPSDDQAMREIAIYVKAWRAMHPDAYARIVGEEETR